MKIVLIRHCDPDYVHDSLTEKGFHEASLLGKTYNANDFDIILSSPYQRARLTCDAVVKNEKEVKVEEWLREVYIPLVENGKEISNFDPKEPYLENHKELFDKDKYLDSELCKKSKDRYLEIGKKIDELIEECGYKKEGMYYKKIKDDKNMVIGIFAHYGTITFILSHLLNIPYPLIGNFFLTLPSSVTTLVSEERTKGYHIFRASTFGSLSHIEFDGERPKKTIKDEVEIRY